MLGLRPNFYEIKRAELLVTRSIIQQWDVDLLLNVWKMLTVLGTDRMMLIRANLEDRYRSPGLESCWTLTSIWLGAPVDSPPSETQAVQLMPAAPMPKEAMVPKAQKTKTRLSFLRIWRNGWKRKSKVTVSDRSVEFVSQKNMEIQIWIW